MTRVFHGQLLGVVALVVATVAACGGGPDQPSPSPPTTPAPPATSTATASPPPTTTPTTAPSPRATATATLSPTPVPTPVPATATPSPTPTAPDATTFRYDTYDTTGAVSTPGSHVFLTDASSMTSATDDYYRMGEAAAILVNVSDSGGVSRAAFYNSIKVGDIIEWYPIAQPDCWKRYKVTTILPDPPGDSPRKLFAIEGLPVEIDECPERSVGQETLEVELRWNPPGAHQGPDGPPTMLQGQPVEGGATYRVAPHAPLRIDVPEDMALVRYTGGIVAAWNPPVGLRDVKTGSTLVLGLHTGEELERRIATSPDDSRDVGVLFDQIVASASRVEATTFRYDTYDTTGAVSTPGSYAFLSDPDDTSTVVTTYEALRDGTTTALLIHTSDADGASQAALYDEVEVGDLFEWHQADDCFVRYRVTDVKPDPAGTVPGKLLAVGWMTYAFTGCSGPIETGGEHRIGWSPANITSPDVTSPIRHGNWLMVPQDWTGGVEDEVLIPNRQSPECEGDPPATLEDHAFGRRPALPDDWVVERVQELRCSVLWVSYRSADWTASVDVYISRGWAVPVHIPWVDPSAVGQIDEATMIDGHPAILSYDRYGLGVDVRIYHSSGIKYQVQTSSQSLTSNRQAVIDIARSVYE